MNNQSEFIGCVTVDYVTTKEPASPDNSSDYSFSDSTIPIIKLDLFRSTFHILLVSTGIPLNFFIAVFILLSERLYKKPRNVLLLDVTFSNLLALLTILIEFLAFHAQNHFAYLVYVSISGLAYTCLLFTLLLALADRYAAIVHPLWHRRKVTVRGAIISQLFGLCFFNQVSIHLTTRSALLQYHSHT